MNSATNDIHTRIQECLEQTAAVRAYLDSHAQDCIQDYWDYHWQHNPNMSIDNKSRMGVRVLRKNDESPYFAIQWYWNKWITDNAGNRLTFSTYIPKGRTKLTYSAHALLKHARDWEADVILDVESRCAGIRRQLQDLNKAEAALKRMLKHSQGASLEPADETNQGDNPEFPPDTDA